MCLTILNIRFKIIEYLGDCEISQYFKCIDINNNPYCLKIVKNE